jgi:hypothetical protein
MPLLGTRDMTPLRQAAPVIDKLDVEPLVLPGVDVLQATFEIDDTQLLEMLPRSVHPTIPPIATFLFWRCPDGPLGPFNLAQVRVNCRAGFRSRGYMLGSYCDSEAAGAVLRSHWGFDCRRGAVTLDRYFDAIIGTVEADGQEILRVSLMNPMILSGADVEMAGNFNLARIRTNGDERLKLVQVEPEYAIERPDRGTPRLDVFLGDAWSARELVPEFPVTALHFRAELRLPRVRYLVDPDLPLQDGTEYVGD